MKLIAAQQQNRVRGIRDSYPLLADLVAEQGAPFAVTFNLFDDPTATNSRGLWRAWSEFEQGEVVYVTPEGPESGDLSIRTPSTFGAWVCKRRSQHSEPGKPGAKPFWTPMKAWDLSGKKVVMTIPGDESLNAEGTIEGGNVLVAIPAVETFAAPSSVPYRLELKQAGDTLLYVAQGQIVFRSSSQPADEPPFTAETGESFEATVKLWQDALHTRPQSLIGWTAELIIDGVRTLTEGHGLTVTDAANGQLTITMTEAEVNAAAPRSTSCTMKIRKEEKVVTMFRRQFLFLP